MTVFVRILRAVCAALLALLAWAWLTRRRRAVTVPPRTRRAFGPDVLHAWEGGHASGRAIDFGDLNPAAYRRQETNSPAGYGAGSIITRDTGSIDPRFRWG